MMKVNELAAMFNGTVKVDSICAWNGRGNTPSKGAFFDTIESLRDAYGERDVKSWKLEGKYYNYIELSVTMFGTDM